MIVDSPLDLIFSNVFIRLRGVASRTPVALKLEGFSVTGSIKIKTAIYMIDALEAEGTARPAETTLVESSSGNLGIALSLVCKLRGYRFLCVTDPNTPSSSLRAMRAYGAEVVIVDQHDANGGYLHTRIAYIQRLLREDPSCIWLNQYANKANQAAHYETTAREILAEFPAPEYLFVGCGSSGTLMGCAQRFRQASPNTRIIAVDPVGSVSFGGQPALRRIAGVGASRRPELLVPDQLDGVVSVSEGDTIRMCHEIASVHGLIVGGSTGAVLAAVRQMDDEILPGMSVVAVSADFGDKYLDTVYNRDWVLRMYGFDPHVDAVQEPLALAVAGGR